MADTQKRIEGRRMPIKREPEGCDKNFGRITNPSDHYKGPKTEKNRKKEKEEGGREGGFHLTSARLT
jgi:hypothetical protein